MIDTYIKCPRCYGEFGSTVDTTFSCPHYTCAQCGLCKYIGETTQQKFMFVFIERHMWYGIRWFEKLTSKIDIDNIYCDDQLSMPESIKFDYWLPFDITLEAVKVYLAFS